MKLGKKELVNRLSKEMSMNKTQTEFEIEQVFSCLSKILKEGYDISIPRFGKFEIVESEARMGRNPKTGEKIEIPAKSKVKFRPSLTLKELVQ